MWAGKARFGDPGPVLAIHYFHLMRIPRPYPNALACCALFTLLVSACTSQPEMAAIESIGQQPSATTSSQGDPMQKLDALYRENLLGFWGLSQLDYGDGSGAVAGTGEYMDFDTNGRYRARGVWNNDERTGSWNLCYTSEPDGTVRCVLFMFDDKHLYGDPYWKYNMLNMSLTIDGTTQRMSLTQFLDGSRIFSFKRP